MSACLTDAPMIHVTSTESACAPMTSCSSHPHPDDSWEHALFRNDNLKVKLLHEAPSWQAC